MSRLKEVARRFSMVSRSDGALVDGAARARKAEKIAAVLSAAGAKLETERLLDIGCSQGVILGRLATMGGFVVGMDMDFAGLVITRTTGLAAVCGDGERLPFADGCFDIVVCNHVYEHTDHPEYLMAEIHRVLRPNGLCYFAGPSRYELIEPHYRLPLLSWLPRWMADRYVRWCRRGTCYDVQSYSYRALRRLIRKFNVEDYTDAVLRDPVRYCADDLLPPGSVKLWLARLVYRRARVVFPGFIFVLRKPMTADGS